jgi:hypothetical protein
VRRHSSFLLRCWDLGRDGEERIEIEHIQSGTKAVARSVEAAVSWICEHGDEALTKWKPVSNDTDLGLEKEFLR